MKYYSFHYNKDHSPPGSFIRRLYVGPERTHKERQWLGYLATKSRLTSRKMKKHSSLGVNARWALRLRLSSRRLFRSMTCRSISSAMGGGDMGSEITQPAGHALLFTYRYLREEQGHPRIL